MSRAPTGRRRLRWDGAVVLVVPAAVLLAWAALSARSDLVPTIGATASEVVDGIRRGWLVEDLAATSRPVAYGFAVAVAVGFPFGCLMAFQRFVREVVEPVVFALFAVPRIVLYPVFLSVFGVGTNAEAAMAAAAAVFPIAIATSGAFKAVDPTLVKLSRSLRMSAAQTVRKVMFPAVAPALMNGIRLGFSVAFINVVIAQLFAARSGLGLAIGDSYALQRYDRMYALVLTTFVVAFVGNLLLWTAERWLRAKST